MQLHSLGYSGRRAALLFLWCNKSHTSPSNHHWPPHWSVVRLQVLLLIKHQSLHHPCTARNAHLVLI
uniref:Putative secreted peptide n=1 Tax=Anopheles braziliensis TaxID=58242 RepID=A0A2M3ZWW7_9DIPT